MRLYELRKNPEQNPKISIGQAIKPYMDGNHVFSFRDDKKVGINPGSDFSTPNGIYAWPKEMIRQDGEHVINVPYAGNAPYVYVLKPTTPPKRASEFTELEILKGLALVEAHYNTNLGLKKRDFNDLNYTPFKAFYEITKSYAMRMSDKSGKKSLWINEWRKMFVLAGIKSVFDDQSIFVGSDEPMMVVFFTNDSYKSVDMLLNKHYRKEDDPNLSWHDDPMDRREQDKALYQRKKGTPTKYVSPEQ